MIDKVVAPLGSDLWLDLIRSHLEDKMVPLMLI